MLKPDSIEAAAIVDRLLTSLLSWVPTRGRSGSDVRSAIGDTIAHSRALCQRDEIGPRLAKCFNLARIGGINLAQLATVRKGVALEQPNLLGAVLVKDASMGICLATEAQVLSAIVFVSHQDIDKCRPEFNDAFNAIEEVFADAMDQMSYQAAVGLHAAVTYFFTESARPLPRMIRYRFAQPIATLHAAHRLYDDAGRADELRAENKIVHPAFAPAMGIALSA